MFWEGWPLQPFSPKRQSMGAGLDTLTTMTLYTFPLSLHLATPVSSYRIVTIPPPLHPPLLPCPPQSVATGLSLYLHPYTPHFYLAHPSQWLQDCHYTSTPTPPTFTLPTPVSGYRIKTLKMNFSQHYIQTML